MFEAIVAKITNTVRKVARAIGVAVNTTPWVAPAAILAVFLVL